MTKTILVALAAALVLLVAAPVVSAQPILQGGAYLSPYSGAWLEVVGGDAVAVHDPGTPIPAETAIWVTTGWFGAARGRVQTVPLYIKEKLSINGDPVVATFADGRRLWTPIYVTEGEPFNPHMGVKVYSTDWMASLGVLPSGTYDGLQSERLTHVTTDLLGGYFEGQHSPVKIMPYAAEYEFSFVVR